MSDERDGSAPALPNGGIWPDDHGVPINAHGGGILRDGGLFYWFGEHKVEGERGNAAWVGVHCYSSRDLLRWKDEGIALAVTKDGGDIREGCVLERPKVVRCPKTGRYVMYFHLELPGSEYRSARVGIAVADAPAGPYAFVRSLKPDPGTWPQDGDPADRSPEAIARSRADVARIPHCGESQEGREALIYPAFVAGGQDSRDMTLFVDDDGKAYHVFSSEFNSTLHISELTDDYLGYSGRWWRAAEKEWTEAPAICRRDGWYYLLGSWCTGWEPNAARIYRARSIAGPWERLGNPCAGVNPANGLGPEKTFGGQSTFLLPLGDGRVIAMFDLWRPSNAIDGRYAWLPVDFSGDMPRIAWRDAWEGC